MKKRTIKVADASGSRRAEDVLVIQRKNPPPIGAIVTVVFEDEYSRYGCQPADCADYVVESCGFDAADRKAKGMCTIWMQKILNAGQRPGDGQLCVHSPAGGARHSAFDLEGQPCAR